MSENGHAGQDSRESHRLPPHFETALKIVYDWEASEGAADGAIMALWELWRPYLSKETDAGCL